MLNSKKLFLASLVMPFIPPTKFYSLKAKIYRWAGVTLGENVRIVSSARIIGSGDLIIGDNAFIGHFTNILVGGAYIKIGKNVDISSNVTMINGSHKLHDIPNKAAGSGFSSNITIEDGAWISASVTLIGGAHIQECAVIAAGATVIDTIPTYSLYGGTPAKFIKNYSATKKNSENKNED